MGYGEYVHAECFGNDRDSCADLAHADDGNILACELRKGGEPVAELFGSYPVAVLDGFVMKADLVCELEKKSYSHLCCRESAVFRDVSDCDTSSPACFKVDYVEARGNNADILKIRKLIEYFFSKRGLVGNNSRGSRGMLYYLVGRCDVVCCNIAELLEGFPVKISGVGGRTVHDYDIHKQITFRFL